MTRSAQIPGSAVSHDAALFFVCVQPIKGSHLSTVLGSLSSHIASFAVCTQPSFAEQESMVQSIWSSQVSGTLLHCPFEHVSVVHGSLSSQTIGRPRQVPLPSQVSFNVQGLPSVMQSKPFGA